ncbi:SixA phosphatase family protein [Gracilimonas amylolytica]|uniref:SixA phosphatase family protein n=1 Tax=Gracilimonas amylolytica TaxID=1749045 RepID=UPI000CD8F6A1|nr:histidine phosphatase family protein [Gracilimonas amylolytica]
MKQILLLRHAKSSWSEPGLSDFERPLAERGLNDAPRMGQFVREIGYQPAVIYSSPAKRAVQTTKLFSESAEMSEDQIQWNEDLYYGSMKDYIEQIQAASDEHERLMMVGHNPIIENTAGLLAGSEHKIAVRMPTAALVCLESFANSWGEVMQGTCQIKWMMIPKILRT